MKEALQRPSAYIQANKGELGGARELDTSDLHVEVIDLLNNRVELEVGTALVAACARRCGERPRNKGWLFLAT